MIMEAHFHPSKEKKKVIAILCHHRNFDYRNCDFISQCDYTSQLQLSFLILWLNMSQMKVCFSQSQWMTSYIVTLRLTNKLVFFKIAVL